MKTTVKVFLNKEEIGTLIKKYLKSKYDTNKISHFSFEMGYKNEDTPLPEPTFNGVSFSIETEDKLFLHTD
jgi:hypothetical protein